MSVGAAVDTLGCSLPLCMGGWVVGDLARSVSRGRAAGYRLMYFREAPGFYLVAGGSGLGLWSCRPPAERASKQSGAGDKINLSLIK